MAHIETRPLSSLKSWDKNPRGIKKADFERLQSLIKKHGLFKPFIITNDGIVLGGNMRLKACEQLGITEVPVSVVDAPTDKERLEYALADNDRAGYYEEDKLAELLATTPDLDLEDYKVDLGKLTPLRDVMTRFSPDDIVEDTPPEVVEDICVSKPGEIYQLGVHRLMCGDSTDFDQVAALMEGRKSTMVFTDPPYNVDYGSSKNPRHKIRSIKNDALDASGWEAFNKDIIANMISFNTGDVYVWGASGQEGIKQRLWLTELGYHWSATIIWKKNQLVLSPANYQRMYEPCFYGWVGRSSYNGDRKQTEVWETPIDPSDVYTTTDGTLYYKMVKSDIWEMKRPTNSKEHPTMKPQQICATGILNSSKPGDIVLDLFGGSGSTLIACEQTGRMCRMMELEPGYCDVIRKRYWKLVDPDNWEERWQDLR